MTITKFFQKADILTNKNGVIIDSKYVSMHSKHYNISITIDTDTNICTITSEKPNFFIDINYDKVPSIDDVVESDVVTYKIFPWSTGYKKIKSGWVELKKRDQYTFTTNNYVIIE
jgi:hypothetical protein